jgi:hypothetical protein
MKEEELECNKNKKDERIILIWICDSSHGQVAGSYDHGNETSGSIKARK